MPRFLSRLLSCRSGASRLPKLVFALAVAFGLSVSAAAQLQTTMTLTQSATSVPANTAVTITATVVDQNGAKVTSGLVTFCNGTVDPGSCTGASLLGNAPVVRSGAAVGTATLRIKSALASGSQIFAQYNNGNGTPTGNSKYAYSSAYATGYTTTGGVYPSTVRVTANSTTAPVTLTATLNQPQAYGGNQNMSVVDATTGADITAKFSAGSVTTSSAFVNTVPATTLSATYTAATGDFNNDGFPDLVTVRTSATTAVMLFYAGKSDGTFASPVTVAVPSNVYSGIVAADINADGNLDVLLRGTSGSSQGIVMLGKGDGTFTQAPATVPMGSVGQLLTPIDINNDGILDIVSLSSSTTVAYSLGNGDGTFGAMKTVNVAANSTNIAIGDFNGDGLPDIVVGHGTDKTLGTLLNNGSGFNAEVVGAPLAGTIVLLAAPYGVTGASVASIAVGVANGSAYSLGVLVNSSQDGTYGSASYFPVTGTFNTAYQLQGVDTRDNGVPDLILTSSGSTVSTFLVDAVNGSGNYTAGPVYTGVGNVIYKVFVQDFNGDGAADLLAFGSTGFELFNGTSTITKTFTGTPPGGGTRMLEIVHAADNYTTASTSNTVPVSGGTPISSFLNLSSSAATVAANGTVTLTASLGSSNAYGNPFTGTVTFTDGSTTDCSAVTVSGSQAQCTTPALATGAHRFTATYSGDVNFTGSTGGTSVRSGAALTTTTTLTTSSATPAAGTAFTLTATPKDSTGAAVTAGQVNFCNASAAKCTGPNLLSTVQVNRTTGAAVLPVYTTGGTHSYKAIYVANSFDLTSTSANVSVTVTASPGTPTVTTLASSGSVGNYTLTGTISTTGSTPSTGAVNFLDTSNSNAQVATAMLGTATIGTAVTYTAKTSLPSGTTSCSNSSGVEAFGDINGDGKMDLITYCNGDYIALGNGDGTFTYSPSPVSNAKLYDINGDGKLDLIGQNGVNTVVAFGNGDGTFGPLTTLFTDSGPASISNGVTILDINGDGYPDVMINRGQLVYTCLNNGNGTFQSCFTALNNQYYASTESFGYADFNNDGILDLYTTQGGSGFDGIYIFNGAGNGTFGNGIANNITKFSGPFYSSASKALDVNGDGNVDLIVTLSATQYSGANIPSSVQLYTGKGNGTFNAAVQLASESTPYPYSFLATGDVNGDGIQDLVIADGQSSSLLLGNGTSFAAGTTLPGNYDMPVDLTGDGLSDFTSTNGTVQIAGVTQTNSATVSGVSIAGPGTHKIVASYAGDSGYAASTSASMSLTGSAATTSTGLAISNTAPAYGQATTLTATITPSSANGVNATGTVSFSSDGTAITGCTAQAVSGGVATCSTAALAVGTHSIVATYGGDSNFKTSASTAGSLTVGKASPTITASAPAITYGTATDTLSAIYSYTGTTAPTGAVTFTVDAGAAVTATCTGSASPRTCTASYNSATLSTGSHNVVATLAADTNYNVATSATATLTVNKAAVTLTTTPATATYGTASTTLTTALAYPGSVAPTGTVTFAIDGGAAQAATCSGTASPLSCSLSLNLAGLATGTHSIAASFATDTNYNAATATAATLTIGKQTPTLTASAPTIVYGTASDTITAMLIYTGSGAVPSGAVMLSVDGGTAVTAACTGSASPRTCTASYNTAALGGGNHTITASYATDANYTAATGTGMFSISPAATALAMSVSQPANGGVVLTVAIAGLPTSYSSGTVTFFDGATILCSAVPLSNAGATCATPTLAVGNHSFTATYSGDANFASSNNNAAPKLVTIDPPTNGNGGATTAGMSSPPVPLQLAFGSNFTLGAINLANSGSPSPAFMIVAGGTCSVGTAYTAGQSCTVNVVYTNPGSGLLVGTVSLTDNTGAQNVVGTATITALGSR